MNRTFEFTSKVWQHPGEAGAWHFVTLPTDLADEIEFLFADKKRGWGSLPVEVSLKSSKWRTSIFPDKKAASYLLPLKASVRKKESIVENDMVTISIEITV